MSEKTCCFIGEKEVSADKLDYMREKLNAEIHQAIKDGYTTFIVGFYSGLNALFAELIMEHKNTNSDLFLEAAVLNHESIQISSLSDEVVQGYDSFRFQQGEYNEDSAMNSDRYMLNLSDRVIIVYDGADTGRSAFAMKYAHITAKEIREIRMEQN